MGESVDVCVPSQFSRVNLHVQKRMKTLILLLSAAAMVALTSGLGALPLALVGKTLVLGSIPTLPFTLPIIGNSVLGLLGVGALAKAAYLAKTSGGAYTGFRLGNGRRKRESPNNNFVDAMGPMLDVQAQLDKQTGCGMKVVCELSARYHLNENLGDEERLILSLFGSQAGPLSFVKSKSKNLYYRSFELGRDYGRDRCVQIFHRCKHSSEEIFNTLKQTTP